MRLSLLCALLIALIVSAVPAPVSLGARDNTSLKGQLLVSTKDNLDPRFHRSVIYMVRHTPTSSFGIVVNKPYGKGKLADMMRGLGLDPEDASGELNLHYGGPVAVNHLFFLHSSDYAHAKSDDIDGTVSFTKDFTILKAIAAGTGPKHIHVAAGYAGWGPGQLEGELERGVWTVAPSDGKSIFSAPKESLWETMAPESSTPL